MASGIEYGFTQAEATPYSRARNQPFLDIFIGHGGMQERMIDHLRQIPRVGRGIGRACRVSQGENNPGLSISMSN